MELLSQLIISNELKLIGDQDYLSSKARMLVALEKYQLNRP